jgi:hypothetical protein
MSKTGRNSNLLFSYISYLGNEFTKEHRQIETLNWFHILSCSYAGQFSLDHCLRVNESRGAVIRH